jgi:acetyl-CoA carboxylase carboxyltransferase component
VDEAVESPLQGTIVSVDVAPGDTVRPGHQLVVIESMKMEHVVAAERGGVVASVAVSSGATVMPGDPLVLLTPVDDAGDAHATSGDATTAAGGGGVRPDLAEAIERHAVGHDDRRSDAVAKRHAAGRRTARENVDDLCDDGSFVEYGALAIAAQRRRRSLDDLVARTPADGLVGGIGTIDGRPAIVMSYDYMVLAGTQGLQNHRKKDRLFELAERLRTPIVFFTEGGGGRPGDTDGTGATGLDTMAFHLFARLSGRVPLVGIVAGYCFAGNAAILGCCDVVIAVRGANIGMGGPAMIEGGGLGVYSPDEVGPTDVQVANGVIDVLVEDEAEAVAVAKQYLAYFTQPSRGATDWSCADQTLLRDVVPENRLRSYDVRRGLHLLADDGSVLELRTSFGPGMVTALVRIEGRAVGVVANDPMHLGGAIDAPGSDKAARFLQLCDAFDVPVLFLCDTPGIMVGPDVETTALVRHVSRLFVTGANLSVPFMTIVLRKGYGLGAQAMAGGTFKAPVFCVAWPTGEFGGMGLEGAVKLGYRRELEAVADPDERQALFDEMVARMYEHGKAVSTASFFEIDDVIDPADSRRWIVAALDASPPAPSWRERHGKKRPNVDTW